MKWFERLFGRRGQNGPVSCEDAGETDGVGGTGKEHRACGGSPASASAPPASGQSPPSALADDEADGGAAESGRNSYPIIGIDFGTSNAVMAIVRDGQEEVIPNAEGERATPCIVSYSRVRGGIVVGTPARRLAVTNPGDTVFSPKSFLGLRPEVVRKSHGYLPFMTRHEGKSCQLRLGPEWHSAEGITAMVFAKLKRDAEAYLGHPVHEAIVTVPVFANQIQRRALVNAAATSGLEIPRFIMAPVAAAVAYGIRREEDEKIAVIDLGGGAAGIAVLEIGDGVYEVKAVNGWGLGGDDFDARIMAHVCAEFAKQHKRKFPRTPEALQRLKWAVEELKHSLSSARVGRIDLPFIDTSGHRNTHFAMGLDRETLERLVEDLLLGIRNLVEPCLRDSGLGPGEIDSVVPVGQQTRMPAVRAALRDVFGKEPHGHIDPGEAAALGAAIQGAVLRGDVRDVLLLPVTPLSLGIETLGGVRTCLIKRNTTIPTRKSEIFSTAADGQRTIEIHVLQGEREMAAGNLSLGRFLLEDIPPAPRGVPQIEVTLDIDANDILNVSAKDLGTGKEQKVTIRGDEENRHGRAQPSPCPPAVC